MGYYTRFELEVIEGNDDLVQTFRDENEYAEYAINGNKCKWDDHEKDIKEFSQKHPDAIFQLTGEGEESGDLWIEYYKNGKVQKCPAHITYDEYDPLKMK